MENLGPRMMAWLRSLPRMTGAEIVPARDAAQTKGEQRRLALEDRRDFTRDFTRNAGLFGAPVVAAGMPAVTFGHEVVKALGEYTPEAFPWARRWVGRSGFFDPVANMGASMAGGLQGLADVYMPGWDKEP